MINFNRRTKIYVNKNPTDMRESYDGLFNRAKNILCKDPFSGHLFLFINKKSIFAYEKRRRAASPRGEKRRVAHRSPED